VVFTLQNVPEETLPLPGLQVTPVAVETCTAKFDLALGMTELPEGFHGAFEYNTDLFKETTIQRMTEHFQRLLEAVVADPSQRLSELPLLSARERQQLLVEWNHTEANFPHTLCIHEWFERQVMQTPDALALVDDDHQLSYAALNVRANRLAHHLRQLGIAPEARVGLFVERSPDLVVGFLATLKAGGTY